MTTCNKTSLFPLIADVVVVLDAVGSVSGFDSFMCQIHKGRICVNLFGLKS